MLGGYCFGKNIISQMGNCQSSSPLSRDSKKKKITVLLVGLDNAGKTTTAKCLLGEPVADVTPTVGFSIVKPKDKKYDVTVYDLGGGQRIRAIWKNYFAETHGLIFVIDAADSGRVDECRQTLQEIIKNPHIAGKPILLLANKQDNGDALDEVDICENLDVEDTVSKYKCRTKIETCSANPGLNNRQVDGSICQGFQWLVSTIAADYDELSLRVQKDVAIQKELQEQDQKERLERVRQLRAEREAMEGQSAGDNQGEDENFENPFVPVLEIMKKLDTASGTETMVTGSKTPTHSSSQTTPEKGSKSDQQSNVDQDTCEQNILELERTKIKKKSRFRRYNKTAPMEIGATSSHDSPTNVQLKSNTVTIPMELNCSGSKAKLEPIVRPASSEIKESWGLVELDAVQH